eukprot:gene6877-7652_t
MELRGNAGEGKRKSDEKIWRENEHMGRQLGDQVKQLEKRKTEFERKSKKEQERFAVQHLNVNNTATMMGPNRNTRRKKISLTTEPYKFIQETSSDIKKHNNNKKQNIDLAGFTYTASDRRRDQSRSMSVSNLAEIGETRELLGTKEDLILPPIHDDGAHSLLRVNERLVTELLKFPREDGEIGCRRRSNAGEDMEVQCNPEHRNTERGDTASGKTLSRFSSGDQLHSNGTLEAFRSRDASQRRTSHDEVFITMDDEKNDTSLRQRKYPRKFEVNELPHQFGQQVIIDRPENSERQLPPTVRDSRLKDTRNRKLSIPQTEHINENVVESLANIRLAPIGAVREAKLENMDLNQKRKIRSNSNCINNNVDAAIHEREQQLSGMDITGTPRVAMLKNLDKKRRMEFEHKISFLPPTNRMFSDEDSATAQEQTGRGGTLSEKDTQRLGNAKRRWLKAYSMAKRNFYGQEDQSADSNVSSLSEKAKPTSVINHTKDPRLLSLVSMLYKCKSICSKKKDGYENDKDST